MKEIRGVATPRMVHLPGEIVVFVTEEKSSGCLCLAYVKVLLLKRHANENGWRPTAKPG
jgi:hypothetical protein